MIKQLAAGGGVNKLPIIIVAGQSNAEGVVPLVDLPSAYAGSQPDIQIWWEGLPSAPITPTFQNMVPGTNTVHNSHRDTGTYDSSVQWGPEQRAAHYLKAKWNKKIYVIKNAFGGLAISWWDSPSGARWVELNRYITQATAWCIAAGKVPEFKSLIWLQGEADVIASTPISTYESKLRALMTNFRAINSYTASTQWVNVKIRSGVIAGGTGETGLQQINSLFQTIANENPTINKVIDPDAVGATPVGTNVHYDASGYLKIGEVWSNLIN